MSDKKNNAGEPAGGIKKKNAGVKHAGDPSGSNTTGGVKGNAAKGGPSAKNTARKKTAAAAKTAPSGKAAAKPAASASGKKGAAAKKPSPAASGGGKKTAAPVKNAGVKADAKNAGSRSARTQRPDTVKAGHNEHAEHKSGAGRGGESVRKNLSASERTEKQREESRKRLGDQTLRNSPEAVRLEQERAKRLYKKNETFFKVVYFIAMALVVICGAFLLSFSVLFHISAINVEIGEGIPYTEEQILGSSGIEIGNNLLAISTSKARENIEYELPYIGKVYVERELPSTVNIRAEAAEVMGLALNSDRQLIVLSTEGKTLEVLHGNNPTGTPIINGMLINKAEVGLKADLEKPEQFETASQVIDSFRKYDVELESITFSSGGSTITAVYDRRLTLKLGSANGLEEKAELASTLIRQGKIMPTESGTLDMTIHGRAIFRPDDVSANNGELEYVYEDKGEPDELYQAELAGSREDAVME